MKPLSYIEEFIRLLHRNLSPQGSGGPSALWLSQRNEGTLLLSDSEANEYRDVASRLFEQFVKKEEMSRRSAERYLQEAIFGSLDLHSRSSIPFEQRLASAVTQLQSRMAEPAESYTCYVPVGGLGTDGLPCKVGEIRFIVLNRAHLRRLSRLVEGEAVPSGTVVNPTWFFTDLKRTDSWGKPAAVVRVIAKDFSAAGDLARREVRRALDVLNFFSDLVTYNHGWVYFPTEAVLVKSGLLAHQANGGMYVSLTAEGPLQPFSLKELKDLAILRPAFRRIHDLMRNKLRSALSDVLLASIQGAGRASVERSREQAFLLFAIALETLILPESDSQELTYRLRVRVAHLLGRDRTQRAALSSMIRDLYKIRSKIVHNGSYQVTDDDLGQLRSITKRSIFRVLLHRTIRRLRTEQELAEWFEGRVLK
jgi:hypothetical protein